MTTAEPGRADPSLIPQSSSGPREGSPARLRRRLQGDLDNIVMRAIHKEPARRYISVEQFSEDIRRHLVGLPISARRDSWPYRAGKFIIRHKLGVTVSALFLLAVAAGVVATIREGRIAARNERRAEQRFRDVRNLANSLMFEIHGSVANLPGAAGARQLIVQRSQEYLDSLAREASGDISLQRELASAYDRLGSLQGGLYESSIGDADAARKSLQKAVDIREAVAAANPNNTEDQVALARAWEQLGRAQWLSPGAQNNGLQPLLRAVAIAEDQSRKHPGDSAVLELLARGYQFLGDLQGGSGLRGGTAALGEALKNHQKALPLFKQVADANPSDADKRYQLARAMLGVGDDYLRDGEASRALEYFGQAADVGQQLVANTNNTSFIRGLAVCNTRMGDALLMLDRPGEALDHYRKEESLLLPLASADPRDIVTQLELVTSKGDIGHALTEAGRVQEGISALQHALVETVRATKTANDFYARTLLASTNVLVGEALERGGNLSAAKSYYQHGLDLYLATVAADPLDLEDAVNAIIARNHIARVLLRSGSPKRAEEHYNEALASAQNLSQSSPDNVELLYALADIYSGLGDVTAAQAKSTSGRTRDQAWQEAASWFEKSLSTWQRLPRRSPVSPNGFRAGDPGEVAQQAKKAKEMAGKHSALTGGQGFLCVLSETLAPFAVRST